MKSFRTRFFVLSLVLLSVYLSIFYMFIEIYRTPRASSSVINVAKISLPSVVVHLDLKGAPPRLQYLKSLLPRLKDNGANGLLMEYEDMFPYSGRIADVSARNSYNRTELKGFIKEAIDKGFEVIPLVQTFGHMEHALKLSEFQHLREVPTYPDSICPSKLESKALVKDMLKQVIEFHNSVRPLKYIHIGFDEVYNINKCDECHERNISSITIYLDYLKEITNIVKRVSPVTTILIWDDMIRTIKPHQWQFIDKFDHIQPVIWNYSPKSNVAHVNLLYYHRRFPNMWLASAFKGADGKTEVIPNFRNRFLNNFNWMTFILDYKFGGERSVYNFNGIILTGWSRYSHMEALCELLTVSIPSLITNILLINMFDTGIKYYDNVKEDPDKFFSRVLESKIGGALSCNRHIDVNNFDDLPCSFEESLLYRIVRRYVIIKTEIINFLNDDHFGVWTIEYYTQTSNINMNSVDFLIGKCKFYLLELEDIETKLSEAMLKYYDDAVIKEYVSSKIYNPKLKLLNVLKIISKYGNMKSPTWGRRPFQSNISLEFN